MEAPPILALFAIAVASVLLGAVAAAETALERASDVRIQALAARGDARARRIAGDVDHPRSFLGPLTSARVLFASFIVALAAYLGTRAYDPLEGALGLGLVGGIWVAIVQMTSASWRRVSQSTRQFNSARWSARPG